MSLLVVAYPELSNADYQFIQSYRKTHDALYFDVIDPHFTFIFPAFDIAENEFIDEMKEKTGDFKKIEFVIRCSTISKDAFKDMYHTFLVPDEGYGQMVRLHDKLYSGLLQDQLRLDIDYIPHIGVGNSQNKMGCKRMVDEWNEYDFSIRGAISHLDIIRYKEDKVNSIGVIELK